MFLKPQNWSRLNPITRTFSTAKEKLDFATFCDATGSFSKYHLMVSVVLVASSHKSSVKNKSPPSKPTPSSTPNVSLPKLCPVFGQNLKNHRRCTNLGISRRGRFFNGCLQRIASVLSVTEDPAVESPPRKRENKQTQKNKTYA